MTSTAEAVDEGLLPSPDETSHVALFDARYRHAARHSVIARSALTISERDGLDAAVLGLDAVTHDAFVRHFARHAEAAARELLDDPAFAVEFDVLPFDDGELIVALGDSITDDSCSWAEILGAAIRLTGGTARIVNQSISGDTTTGAIDRVDLLIDRHPDWVVQLLGTNDARRHGLATRARMLSLAESARNFEALGSLLSTEAGARLVRMTPPPILQDRVDAWVPFAERGLSWRAEDVEELAAVIRERHPDIVDLHAAFQGSPLRGEWLTVDGVHPTIEGQKQIVRTLVHHLARQQP